MSNPPEIEKLLTVQKVRKVVVVLAVGLLVLSMIQRVPDAGVHSLRVVGSGGRPVCSGSTVAARVRQPATNAWLNAAIFFAVSILRCSHRADGAF